MKGEIKTTGRTSTTIPLRVCVVEFLGRGGLINYAYQFCSALSDQGMEVELITDSNYELATHPHNFPVRKLWNLWDPRPQGVSKDEDDARSAPSRFLRRGRRAIAYYTAWAKLIRYVRKTKPDIVQFGEIRFAADLIPPRILRSTGAILVDVCHNVLPFDTSAESADLLRDSDRLRSLFKRIYKTFSLIFVHSEINRSDFIKFYGNSNVVVIPHGNEDLFTNGGEPEVTAATLRQRLCIADDVPVALFFGTLTKYKGLDVLVEAFQDVVQQVPNAKLVVAGFPNPDVDLHKLRKSVDKNGLRDSIIFCPEYIPLAEVKAFFDISWLVVLQYRMIFQSGALQVAYSCGKPVVASAVGGLIEAVEDGSTGILVPVGDSKELASAIVRLLSDRETAERMGRRAWDLSRTVYGWDSIARTVKHSYLQTAGTPADQ